MIHKTEPLLLPMTLHTKLDWSYGEDGDDVLRQMLAEGADVNARYGAHGETPLHVATRRRRKAAVQILLDHGADIDAKTLHGKTAYAHAVRRRFDEVAGLLALRGASTALNAADRLAVAVVNGRLDEARRILAEHPSVVRTGNPEEDRLLADVAGGHDSERVAWLIGAGANIQATGLDSGTPLHQAAWFGQPANARLLIEAGAAVSVFDTIHESSPLGWAVHGSRFSGGAEQRQEEYVKLVQMLLEAGSSLVYPDKPNSDAYLIRLHNDASPQVKAMLPESLE